MMNKAPPDCTHAFALHAKMAVSTWPGDFISRRTDASTASTSSCTTRLREGPRRSGTPAATTSFSERTSSNTARGLVISSSSTSAGATSPANPADAAMLAVMIVSKGKPTMRPTRATARSESSVALEMRSTISSGNTWPIRSVTPDTCASIPDFTASALALAPPTTPPTAPPTAPVVLDTALSAVVLTESIALNTPSNSLLNSRTKLSCSLDTDCDAAPPAPDSAAAASALLFASASAACWAVASTDPVTLLVTFPTPLAAPLVIAS
mmetsp:Transcript_5939/g.11346  ORF Transcript_5939/g.11346 Transcript_5939/m.11346 type:complete len:267 (+) Transcript_5939:776-1576(+)